MEDLIHSGLMGIAGLVFTIVSMELRSYIAKKKSIMGYEFDVATTERILDKAVTYAEGFADVQAKKYSNKISSIDKLAKAKVYLDRVDPTIALKLGGQLAQAIERKVIEKYS